MDTDRKPIRFVCTRPGADTEAERATMGEHYRLAGPGWPNKTDAQREHADQVISRKVGWNGAGPIWEHVCPACGIRWRRE